MGNRSGNSVALSIRNTIRYATLAAPQPFRGYELVVDGVNKLGLFGFVSSSLKSKSVAVSITAVGGAVGGAVEGAASSVRAEV